MLLMILAAVVYFETAIDRRRTGINCHAADPTIIPSGLILHHCLGARLFLASDWPKSLQSRIIFVQGVTPRFQGVKKKDSLIQIASIESGLTL